MNPLASPILGGTRCALDKSDRAALSAAASSARRRGKVCQLVCLGGAATSHAAGLSGMGVRRATLASAERRALR